MAFKKQTKKVISKEHPKQDIIKEKQTILPEVEKDIEIEFNPDMNYDTEYNTKTFNEHYKEYKEFMLEYDGIDKEIKSELQSIFYYLRAQYVAFIRPVDKRKEMTYEQAVKKALGYIIELFNKDKIKNIMEV